MFPDRYKAENKPVHEIFPEDYRALHRKLISSTVEERKNMPGMEAVRVEMIVLATIFVNFTITQCEFEKILQSDYSLKEGIVAEMLNI
jgi:exopolyphosphatase/guanosine-5'-triphosphate,3'-diphosphate pyrophosphatase